MENTKKENRALTRNLIFSSIVWAVVILGCSFNTGNSKKEITYIILSGFFIELLRMSSLNKSLKKDNKGEVS
ncbi:MAG: hypothetical protein ACI8RP_001629 [Urechidicola sp.]|jgi:hypothetical protein